MLLMGASGQKQMGAKIFAFQDLIAKMTNLLLMVWKSTDVHCCVPARLHKRKLNLRK